MVDAGNAALELCFVTKAGIYMRSGCIASGVRRGWRFQVTSPNGAGYDTMVDRMSVFGPVGQTMLGPVALS